jgi:uncharacterized paraquat-inducible protein A
MSQVVESANSCQSCQQDLYKSERGSLLVKFGLLLWSALARIILYIVARRSVFSLFLLSLSLLPNTSAVISRLLPSKDKYPYMYAYIDN